MAVINPDELAEYNEFLRSKGLHTAPGTVDPDAPVSKKKRIRPTFPSVLFLHPPEKPGDSQSRCSDPANCEWEEDAHDRVKVLGPQMDTHQAQATFSCEHKSHTLVWSWDSSVDVAQAALDSTACSHNEEDCSEASRQKCAHEKKGGGCKQKVDGVKHPLIRSI